MSGQADALETFTGAAIEWAAGGRSQPLVDAAADALAVGLDSPTLRVLAGAPRASADQEATDLAPRVFEELGLAIAERFSSEAVVAAARHRAAGFLAEGGSPRTLTAGLYRMNTVAGYPDELHVWTSLESWYDLVEHGVITASTAEIDEAVVRTARALSEGREAEPISLGEPFVGRGSRRSWVVHLLRRKR